MSYEKGVSWREVITNKQNGDPENIVVKDNYGDVDICEIKYFARSG
jgi:hypothetical protein